MPKPTLRAVALLPVLFLAPVLARGQEPRPVSVSLELLSPSPERVPAPAAAKLRAVRVAGSGSGEEVRTWEVQAPTTLQLDLGPESPWSLTVEAPGYWAPAATLPAGERSPVRLLLLPTTTVTGQVAVPAGERRPAALALRFQAAPRPAKPAFPASQLLCPIGEDRFRCEIPAGTLDLRLQAEGFVPRYLWDVALPPGGRSDLGRIDLVHGASIVGRVEVEGATAEARGHSPQVELSPHLLARSSSAAVSSRMAAKTLSSQAGPRGFFQFTGVPAGEYVATARLAGFAPSRTAPLTVRSGQETELRDPLTLHLPLALEVHLNPPLDPFGQPWQIELSQPLSAHLLETAGQGPASPSGTWRKEGLAPGSYQLQVSDLAGSIWKWDPVEVAAGLAPVEIDLGLVAVAGRITRGKEPLSATLWFGRRDSLQRIRFDSDERGQFAGALPAEGEWAVALETEGSPAGEQTLEPVAVKRLPNSPSARLEIHVPDTRLVVQVVDASGKPVPKALVAVLSSPEKRRREAQVYTDDQGEARLSGVAPGRLFLSARAAEAASDTTACDLREGTGDPPVRLVVRDKIRLKGRVLAPEGPVPGALVHFAPARSATPGTWPARAVSDADGSFQLSLDPSYSGGSLAVLAPGFSVRLLPTPPDWKPEREILIPVRQEGGDLLLDFGPAGPLAARRLRMLHAGADLPLSQLFLEAQSSPTPGGGATLPRMEPGEYLLCDEGGDGCVAGTLSSGGELKLGVRDHRSSAAGSTRAPGERP